jgi:hypothetical protein
MIMELTSRMNLAVRDMYMYSDIDAEEAKEEEKAGLNFGG